jgi:DNA-binding transcriptional regulator YdaS (Cro superfamily)
MNELNGLQLAIMLCGNQNKLADRLGVTRQTVSVWKRRGVPLHGALAIEQRLGIAMHLTSPKYFNK